MSTPDFTSKAWSFIETMELGAGPTVIDPVCEREIGLENAAGCVERDGWAFFFCSEDCQRRFLERGGLSGNPEEPAGRPKGDTDTRSRRMPAGRRNA